MSVAPFQALEREEANIMPDVKLWSPDDALQAPPSLLVARVRRGTERFVMRRRRQFIEERVK